MVNTLAFDSPEEEPRAPAPTESDRTTGPVGFGAAREDGHNAAHVRRERVEDTSVDFTQGGVPARPGVGEVRYSRLFADATEAQREADAWNGAGDFERHGPTDWQATVEPGLPPDERAPEPG